MSVLGLIVLSPVLAVTAVLVRMRLGPPVLFRQIRPGRGGKPFTLLKFKSMFAPAPGKEHLDTDHERTPPFGVWLRSVSLDEIPQLLNVLRGDMSLVGPRPLKMVYLERYSAEQARRLDVLPGVTGWAQVNGRNALSWERKFELDVWYVDHLGLWLDLRILAKTVARVVRPSGVSATGHATMPDFMGSGPPGTPGDRTRRSRL